MSGIQLHPKYGVNPTLTVCWICGKEKGEIALLGAKYKGEAPMHMVLDREPCDECKALMTRGVMVFGTTAREDTDDDPYEGYTGSMMVVSEDFVERILRQMMGDECADEILEKRACFMADSIVKRMCEYHVADPETRGDLNVYELFTGEKSCHNTPE